ncbi:MAG: glycoside hydrolase family 1 protein [Chloroflexota bacterium]|nr:glycoside hydrolase family 1 protein [Chloroflexota bacterium]
MAKRKQESGKALGHDPFEGLDMEWMEQEEGEPSIKVLGHDPFEGLDTEWMDQERDELSPRLAQEETGVALGEVGAGPVLSAVEGPALEQVAAEIELLAQPKPLEPLRTGQPTGVAPARAVMPEATFHFPAGFKWGVATAAYQVEGNNTNSDWWAWEQQEGHIKDGHRSGLACNWWESAEADFDRVVRLGLNALRLSVEWSRIEPRAGEFDDAALERYGQMLQGLRERNIEPMVTLHHFTNPLWLAERGGWENPEAVALFARFVRRVVESLGEHCDLWCTINEPNVYGYMGYLEGVFPPGESDFQAAMRVIRHLLAGHAAAYREIHALQPQARVGFAHNVRIFDPYTPRSLLDRRVARIVDKVYNQNILTALARGRWALPMGLGLAWKLRHTLDWIGLNYYTRDLVAFDSTQRQALFSRRLHADDAELLDGDYGEFYPRGIFRSLQRLARLGLPIYVTENGIPDDDDDQRHRYLLTHLHQMWHAIQLCYPVMGYYHWTLVDNFEWAEGWALRFGLIALDPETQARTPRRSADLYADVIRANSITSQTIDAYAPELRAELLPR